MCFMYRFGWHWDRCMHRWFRQCLIHWGYWPRLWVWRRMGVAWLSTAKNQTYPYMCPGPLSSPVSDGSPLFDLTEIALQLPLLLRDELSNQVKSLAGYSIKCFHLLHSIIWWNSKLSSLAATNWDHQWCIPTMPRFVLLSHGALMCQLD